MSKYKVGDKFEIEIEDVLTNEKGEALYRIKPFAALTFNDYGLNLLKQIEPEEPEVDWSKVKVDTPILVRNLEDVMWNKRYFAEYKDGLIYAFGNGHTSWIDKATYGWKYAKLAEV